MTFAAPDPVAAGQVFVIEAVAGRAPRSLDDFVGEAVITLHWAGQDRLIAGQGSRDGTSVRFYEKDIKHDGKDVRVWTVNRTDQPGQFTACTTHP